MEFLFIKKFKKRGFKPRKVGLTLVEDTFSCSNSELAKLLDYFGEYVDIVRFPAISSLLVDVKKIRDRINIYKENNIKVCLSGSTMELAFSNNKVDDLLSDAKKLNYDMIEISFSGAFSDKGDIERVIEKVKKYNVDFLVEVGYKDSKADLSIPFNERVNQIKKALKLGAFKVVLEGRNGNFLYNQFGFIREDNIQKIGGEIDFKYLIFELPPLTPTLEVISDYIRIIGINANLGNVPPNYVLILEMFRRKWKGR